MILSEKAVENHQRPTFSSYATKKSITVLLWDRAIPSTILKLVMALLHCKICPISNAGHKTSVFLAHLRLFGSQVHSIAKL